MCLGKGTKIYSLKSFWHVQSGEICMNFSAKTWDGRGDLKMNAEMITVLQIICSEREFQSRDL